MTPWTTNIWEEDPQSVSFSLLQHRNSDAAFFTSSYVTSRQPSQIQTRTVHLWTRSHQARVCSVTCCGEVCNPHRCLSGCCVYEKPRQFGESSSESEGDDDEEGCGSAHCILGHGRRGHGQTGGGGPTAPPSAGATHSH